MEKNQEKFKKMVPTYKKLEFLRWINKNHEMVYREGKWLIAFLLVNPLLVEKFEFVFNGDHYKSKKALIISAYRQEEKENLMELYDRGFLFYNEGAVFSKTPDVIKQIEESTDTIYVEINYKNYDKCDQYITVLSKKDEVQKETAQSEVDALLNHILYHAQVDQLRKEIDASLENGDEKLFYELTDKLREHQQKKTLV